MTAAKPLRASSPTVATMACTAAGSASTCSATSSSAHAASMTERAAAVRSSEIGCGSSGIGKDHLEGAVAHDGIDGASGAESIGQEHRSPVGTKGHKQLVTAADQTHIVARRER